MRITVLTPFPLEDRSSAGAQYVSELVTALAQAGDQLEVFYPARKSTKNTISTDKIVEHSVVARSLSVTAALHHRIMHVLRAIDPGPGVMGAFMSSAPLRDSLRGADLLLVQFTEMLPVARRLQGRHRRLPVVVMEHDVFTQAVRRGIAARRWRTRLSSLARFMHVGFAERRLLNAVDLVQVFKPEDAALLSDLGVKTSIQVTDLNVTPRDKVAPSFSSSVMFFGAFKREVNVEAVVWLLDEVWPLVLRDHPDAVLTLVGNHSDTLLAKLDPGPSVRATGFVDSLGKYYAQGAVCIAPIRRGAGVKVKVLDALSFGLPVVATSVAAEGIAARADQQSDESPFLLLADTSSDFAKAISRLLSSRELRFELGESAHKWIVRNYNFHSTVQRMRTDFRELCDSADRRLVR